MKSQKFFCRDPGVYGHTWMAKYTLPVPLSATDLQKELEQNSKAKAESGRTILTLKEAISSAVNALATRPGQ